MTAKNLSGRAVVLVAEDDEDNRAVMKKLLELRGYEVLTASNGQEAVETAEREQPDLILMDLKMPVLNGLAAARHIRQHSRRRIPIVALSAYDPSQHRAVAMAAGCDDYVLKPIDYDRLERLIDSLLSDARPPRVAEQKKPSTGELLA